MSESLSDYKRSRESGSRKGHACWDGFRPVCILKIWLRRNCSINDKHRAKTGFPRHWTGPFSEYLGRSWLGKETNTLVYGVYNKASLL